MARFFRSDTECVQKSCGANAHDVIVRFWWRGSRLFVTSERVLSVENLGSPQPTGNGGRPVCPRIYPILCLRRARNSLNQMRSIGKAEDQDSRSPE